MQQFNNAGKPCTPNIPWLVDNVNTPIVVAAKSLTANLVLYEKDAAGSTVVVPLDGGRIMNRRGDKIGSYWGSEENLQYSSVYLTGVVLTDTAAALEITDATYDLEKLFESATKARYIIKLIDNAGQAYYGYIGGIAKSGSVYTLSIYTTPGLATQTWIKTWGATMAAPYNRVEIYENSTSFECASADTFNEELPYSEFATDYDQLKNLANGQYRIDYRRGRFLGRKLNGDNTEVFTYITMDVPAPTALSTIASAVAIPTTLTGGSKTVAVPGTAEALGASLACKSVYIRAKKTNTTDVYVGDSAVDKTTSQQIILSANDVITINISDIATVYIDADTAGEGVDYLIMS